MATEATRAENMPKTKSLRGADAAPVETGGKPA
jgi:hypothetical protein